MTGKRAASNRDKRAVGALTDALRTGSLQRTDHEGAVELLVRTLPDVARLSNHALRFLAKNSLRIACKNVPPPGQPVPKAPSPDLDTKSDNPTTPKANQAIITNSNDLLPSIRPRTPMHPPSTVRKRRRVGSRAANDDLLGDEGRVQSFLQPRPQERLNDVGGISNILEDIRELVEWPLIHEDLYEHLGVDPPRGILLHGPPGCGKTLLAHAIAGDYGVSFLRVSGPEIVSGMSGESERKIRGIFDEAARLAPSIVFVDEVDAIASRREGASKEMERRIVSQLLTCIDNLGCRAAPKKDVSDLKEGGQLEEPSTNADMADGVATDGKSAGADGDVDAKSHPVIVIAATNRPESLEPALRRAGRFDREIELGAPDEEARKAILSKLCCRSKLSADVDLEILSKRTAGYVGADLHLLAKEAGLACIRRFTRAQDKLRVEEHPDEEMSDARPPMNVDSECAEGGTANGSVIAETGSDIPEYGDEATGDVQETDIVERELFRGRKFDEEELQKCAIEMRDFADALDTIQPSALREGFATRPDVSWENVGSLEAVREEMIMAVVEPIRRPEAFASLGLAVPAGVLLYGPPGCGKTLLARAVAAESGANFISVKGPELLSKYVGDSELAVRKLFSRARSSSPCVIFFDELDALAPRRGGISSESGASERVVNMLLTEMDGFSSRKQVFLVAATNRPDIIDPAMLRPGRLDKLLYVPLPDEDGRVSILKTLIRNVKVGEDVDVESVARNKKCTGFSGADLQALIRTAGEKALREQLLGEKRGTGRVEVRIELRHFEHALCNLLPSVSPRDARLYRHMQSSLRKTRGHLSADKVEANNEESDDPRLRQ